MTPRVSVLVPAYNDGRFLDTCLRSLEAQAFGDFEAIVADDASTDSTAEIARAWATRDARFRWSPAPRNLGMNPNWNRALREARGDFVAKLDADDFATPVYLESLRAEFDFTPDLLFAACRTQDCDEAGRITGPFLGERGFELHGLESGCRQVRRGLEWLRYCFDDIQLWHSDAQMYRRADLLALGGWDERWFSSDTDLILRGLSLDRPVAHVPEVGVVYRRREGSGSDLERRAGALSLPLAMMSLRTLASAGPRLRPLGRPLRQNWWRLWRLFLEQSRTQPASGALELLIAETRRIPPPWPVRVEGQLRWRLWRLRRFLASGG